MAKCSAPQPFEMVVLDLSSLARSIFRRIILPQIRQCLLLQGQFQHLLSLLQDSASFSLTSIPHRLATLTFPAGRRIRWPSEELEKAIPESLLAEISAATEFLRRLLVDLSAIVCGPCLQPVHIGTPPSSVLRQFKRIQRLVNHQRVRGLATLIGGQAASKWDTLAP